MDPPPPPPPSLFPLPTTTSAANHPDSASSSPRSRPDTTTTWPDDLHHLPPIPGGAKLRLMCSYGGHIIPRPHDKSLCYVGGDTRIVVVDRHSSLAELHSRLSLSLLNGRRFTLKYQLPSEDLDSLISLSSDEDLENMIDEYDRTASSSPLKPSRLRLFLFPSKPETAVSMGSLLDDAKSETWFVDALNGAGLLPRGLSDSAAIDSLLDLDQNKQLLGKSNAAQEVVAAAVDSPPPVVAETSSSFGSSSSSPSMANLPPIKVTTEDYLMVGLDEQFAVNVSVAPPISLANATTSSLVACGSAVAKSCGENRVVCDDERSEKSDHGTAPPPPTGLRKPPLPLQPVQRKLVDIHNLPSPDSKHAAGYNLPSPDSVASDCSIASAGSLSKHTIYQDTTQIANCENRAPSPVIDPKISSSNIEDPSTQQVIESASVPPPHQNQQQFIPNTHYIQHPISSYYPMYLHPQTQQTDPQYPMYLFPPLSHQPQPAYDASISRPLTPSLQPVYPTKPEMAAANLLVQVPAHQFQQHYIGAVSHIAPPPQPNAGGGGGGVNYGYEYSHHMQDQGYNYAQQQAAAAPPPQFQTMTPAAAVMFAQASSQLPADNTAQQ